MIFLHPFPLSFAGMLLRDFSARFRARFLGLKTLQKQHSVDIEENYQRSARRYAWEREMVTPGANAGIKKLSTLIARTFTAPKQLQVISPAR